VSGRDCAAWWVLTFGGSGAAPVAPGTAGSLAALAVAAALWGAGLRAPWLFPALALAIGLLHLACGARIVSLFGKNDPGAVVSDEACGLWIALSAPLPADAPWGWSFIVGFALFRLFDIAKPLGVRRLERVPGAWGVLLDDVLAGIYAGSALWAIGSTGVLSRLPA
jgi:phosphatidylglycerophosphatase A